MDNASTLPGGQLEEVPGGKTTEQEVHDSGQKQPDSFSREYVEKLRRENAGYRTKLKELEPVAAELKKKQEASKSDLEKALGRIAELEEAAKTASMHALRAKVAAEAGIPADLLPTTDDEDKLRERATALKEWAEAQKPTGAPTVNAVGKSSGSQSRDELARSILGF